LESCLIFGKLDEVFEEEAFSLIFFEETEIHWEAFLGQTYRAPEKWVLTLAWMALEERRNVVDDGHTARGEERMHVLPERRLDLVLRQYVLFHVCV